MAEKQLKSLKFYGLDDVYIIPKMYISDPSKDGNVKICFGIPSAGPTLISFTLLDEWGGYSLFNGNQSLTLTTEENMTWDQWLQSDYCTIKEYLQVNNECIYIKDERGCIYNSDWTNVFTYDIIIPNGEYFACD